ncbi:hypothetical protein BJ742DRAFT_822581 [Cladochytrium replicatum]|nr:hypothetical protein BJ742DRAFT_822581 [Cladochytrium replicatum]
MDVHRSLGAGERWRLERNTLGTYGAVAWGVRYTPADPCPNQETVIKSLAFSCAQLLELHPRLRLGVRSPRSNPLWIVLPSGTTPTPFLVAQNDRALELMIASDINYFFDVETESSYLWRISVSFDSLHGSMNIVFAAHHALLDGMSGMQVLFDYIRLLYTGSAEKLLATQKVARTELSDDLPIETLAPLTRPSLFTRISSKLPRGISSLLTPRIWSPLHEVLTKDLTPHARTLPRPFNSFEIRAELQRVVRSPDTIPPMRTTNIRIPHKSRLLALARRHSTTIHGALVVATQDSLAAVYGLNESTYFAAESDGSLRPNCVPPQSSKPYALGNLLFTWIIPGHPNTPLLADTFLTPSLAQAYRDAFWADAKQKKEELLRTKDAHAQRVGMRSFIPGDGFAKAILDQQKFDRGDVGGITFEISNLLEWEFPKTLVLEVEKMAFDFVHLLWSQPQELDAPVVSVNVASVPHTDEIYCSLSYRAFAGVRIVEVETLGETILNCFKLILDDSG